MVRLVDAFWAVLIVACCSILHVSANRLPTSIQPEHYHLKIITHLIDSQNITFNGDVSLRFQVVENTRNITLHIRDLDVDTSDIQLKSLNEAAFQLCLDGIDMEPEHDFFIIRLCQTLLKDHIYEVKLSFMGVLNDNLSGYAHDSYMHETSREISWLSLTNFFPNGARLAFPCLDEPNYKASFSIWLGHHKSLTALSNMPLEKQIPLEGSDDYVWSVFEETPRLPTYLVAYSVNDFVHKESKVEGSEIVVRTWCPPDEIDQCDIATEMAPKIFKYYENMFGIPLPLKKLDQIAIPHLTDSSVGHWGLVMYEESYLFADPKDSPTARAIMVDKIVKELAQQWFGNLVTLKWWNDWWLYEGIGNYLSTWAQNSLHYVFRNIIDFDTADGISDITIPQNTSSHDSGENEEVFRPLLPWKGSAIVRMIHIVLGQNEFFEALHDFFIQYKYEKSSADDFWAFLTERAHTLNRIRSGVTLKTIVDSWTLQSGYPMVNVTRNYESGTIEISQSQYLQSTDNEANGETKKCWWIPLSYTTASELDFHSTPPKAWLECDESGNSVPLNLDNVVPANEWIIFKNEGSNLYRVMYDTNNWRLISNDLKGEKILEIHSKFRSQIVNDVIKFESGSFLGTALALEILEYLINEPDNTPWVLAFDMFNNVMRLLMHYPRELAHFKAYVRYIIAPIYYSVGGLYETEGHQTIALKYEVADLACRAELQDCVQSAITQFQKWKNSQNLDAENGIPQTTKDIVYRTAILHGNSDDWNFLWHQYKSSSSNIENNAIIESLACSSNETILRDYIDILFSKETLLFTTYHQQTGFSSIASTCGYGASVVHAYMAEHIDSVRNDYVHRVLPEIAKYITSTEERNNFSKFINSKKINDKLVFDIINDNIKWIERNLAELRSFLESRLSVIGNV